jgi:N-dimethylarginine dimethylaminohydrolase
MSTYRILMCEPAHFEVSYTINPWMRPDEWAENRQALTVQSTGGWSRLVEALQGLGAHIDFVVPAPGLPDLVFTANAAVVMDGKALVARFKYAERQGEEPLYYAALQRLQQQGVLTDVQMMPEGIVLEGAGDCVYDEQRRLFWMGYGMRSDIKAVPVVKEHFGLEVIPLELVNPHYYHMDTALVPMQGGEVLYYPGAFSAEGRKIIEERVGKDMLIAAPEEDAARLAVNCVNLGRDIVLAVCSDTMRGLLEARGYTLHQLPITTFSKSGGSAFCLTLRLDRVSKN